jgi:hypothetical protein
MTDWRIVDGGGNIEADLFDVEVTETADNFGDGAVAFLDDSSGDKFEQYPRGTRIDFEAKERSESTYSTELVSFVVERREKDKNGADVLEIECYDITHLLRRGQVKTDLSGQSLSSALQTIITESTPITYNSSKVTVLEDLTITRSYLNERVDVVLQEFALLSGNEEFFVDSDIEFVWQPRENSKVSRGVDNSQWLDYDIPEKAESALNEVRVYYDDGERVVTVDNPSGKKELQENIGTDRPVTFSEEKMFDDITNRDDAIAAGQRVLADREPTLTGTVTTYGLLDAEPGDAIDIVIPPRGINGEFRIAQIEYLWGRDETVLTIIENRGDIDDMLKRMSDTLKRVEMRIAVQDAQEDDRQIDIGGPGSGESVGIRINTNVSGDIGGTDVATTSVMTNAGLNAVRDGYINAGTVTIDTIAVGTDGTTPSRADTSLGSQSESVSATVSTPDNSTVRVSGSFTTGDDIREVGFFDGSGNLLCRAVTQSAVTSPSSATLDVAFKNDDTTQNSVITQTGQTLLRDILAANSPTHVDRYVLGSGTTAVSESDTALATLEATANIGNTVLREIDYTAGQISRDEFGTPLVVGSTGIEIAQTAFTEDAQDLDLIEGTTFSDTAYTGDTGVDLDSTGYGDYTVTPEYDGGNWGLALRGEFPDTNWRVLIGSKEINPNNFTNSSLGWESYDIEQNIGQGETTVISVSRATDGSTSSAKLDAIVFYDKDEHSVTNFDDAPDPYLTTPRNHSSGPVTASLDTLTSNRETDSVTLSTTWTDTTGGQAIRVNGNTASNTQSNTFSLTSTDTFNIEFDIDAFGTQSQSPSEGVNSQAVEDYKLSLGDSGKTITGVGAWSIRSFFESGQVGGVTLTEGGQKDSNGNLVTRTVFSQVTPSADSGIIIDEEMVINVESRPDETAFYAVTITDQDRS